MSTPIELKKFEGNVSAFGDHESAADAATLPEPPQKRKCTDVPFLIALATCLIFMVPLSAVFSIGGDLNRLIYGYDRHGNTCGFRNKPIYGVNCSGQDMTQQPISLVRYYRTNKCLLFSTKRILPFKCIESCDPPNQLIFHRCYPPLNGELDNDSKSYKKMTEFFHILNESAPTILGMTLAGLMLSFTIFICLQWHVAGTFWILTIFQLIVSITSTVYFWHKYVWSEDRPLLDLLLGIGSMLYFIFLLLYVVVLHDNLHFSISIHKEALNAISRMRMILLQPLLTVFALIVCITCVFFLILLIGSNECLERAKLDPFSYEYVPNALTFVYACYLAVLILWIFAFAEGYQAMIVSGAVANYYFTKDKSALHKPLRRSFSTLIRYHLGTVAFGSVVVILSFFIRAVAAFFVRKVYINTAMRGEPFCRSSLRAIRLLCHNLIHTVTLTGFNYVITYGFTFLAILLTVGVGLWMNLDNSFTYYVRMGILFGAAGAATTAFFVINILNIVTETLYFCCCEERLSKEGIPNPVYVNPGLVNMIVKRSNAASA